MAAETEARGQALLSAGAALRGGRERLAMSVGDAARHLRLSVRQVEALEAGDEGRLPFEPFLSGFIRNYARLVQLNPEPLLAALRETAPRRELSGMGVPESTEIPFPSGQQRPWGRYAAWGLLVGLALALLAYEGFQEYKPAPPAAAPAAKPLPAAVPAPAEALEAPSAPVLEVLPAPQAAPAAEAATAPAPAGSNVIHLRFEGESWVEIRDRDGKILFSQVSPRGSVRAVAGAAPLSVVIGSAANVRLTYRDQAVDLAPHTRSDVARLTLE
ncbi:MAG TPA: RodZ domain-containing protein [Burkholderiales bacterium]|nr:RodZ domain-containing protein [Burkholderiales bacterium]